MRVLVTGGNTVVPIDQVRCISNVFRGRTGANIALEACRRGHHVHLLASDPDVLKPEDKAALPAEHWKLERYRTFDDLHSAMRHAIEGDGVDAVIHSAAVSDYRVEGSFAPAADTTFSPETLMWETRDGTPARMADRGAGKVKSNELELWFRMVQNPKLIDLIRPLWRFLRRARQVRARGRRRRGSTAEIAERSSITRRCPRCSATQGYSVRRCSCRAWELPARRAGHDPAEPVRRQGVALRESSPTLPVAAVFPPPQGSKQ